MTRRQIVGLWLAIAGLIFAVAAFIVAAIPFGDCPALLADRAPALCPAATRAAAGWFISALVAATPLVITGAWLAVARRLGPDFIESGTGRKNVTVSD